MARSKPETGPDSAGQSGDLQGLTESDEAANESVAELIEEGQFHEASILDGIETSPKSSVFVAPKIP